MALPVIFIIASHPGLPGVFLSLRDQWGNLPFPSDQAAAEHARAIAKRTPFAIERVQCRARARLTPPK